MLILTQNLIIIFIKFFNIGLTPDLCFQCFCDGDYHNRETPGEDSFIIIIIVIFVIIIIVTIVTNVTIVIISFLIISNEHNSEISWSWSLRKAVCNPLAYRARMAERSICCLSRWNIFHHYFAKIFHSTIYCSMQFFIGIRVYLVSINLVMTHISMLTSQLDLWT